MTSLAGLFYSVGRVGRRSKRCVNRPVRLNESVSEGHVPNASFRGPFFQRESLPIVGKPESRAAILVLNFLRCPSAVGNPTFMDALIAMTTRVVTVGVNPINAVGGSWA